ncbi:pentatricopeptide repeat-containing protein At1g63330-like [Malania oleifera]|uniref:pentatricopeptide repeat-containing protein At1g63330-like n=1 Tax=Malania oleifera TaxID=397392 RepID=UPI0025ADAB2D|nr:pentatricopeptide repeat-containing protein At1g63330-like [Malania oleifera]
MAVKLSRLAFFKTIPKWASVNARVASFSCANQIQNTSEDDHTPHNTSDFEAKIQFLRNKLSPDNLTRVLDSTNDLGSALKIFKWAALQKRFRHTRETYCSIISKLGMNGCVQEMEGFCAEMVRERCPGLEDAFAALIVSFVRDHRVQEAIRVLVAMSLGGYKPNVVVFNLLLSAIVEERRDFQSVLFVYKEMVKAGIVPTVDTLNYLLEALFGMEQIDSTIGQFRRMNKKGCHPNSRTFEIIISGLVVRNRVNEATTILHEMFEAGFEPDLSFYTSTIPLFCSANKPEQGIRLLRMMTASKMVPNSLLYEVLIHCLCENLYLKDAIGILEEMIEHGVIVVADVFVKIIECFCKLGRFNEAKGFLEEKHVMEALPHNALLGGYCNAGDISMAQSVFEKMVERNMADSDSWNILIRWFCENSNLRKAYETLGRMIVTSFIPDYASYSALVVGNCKLNEYRCAMELFHRIRGNSWVLDSVCYAELLGGLCQAEKLQEAAEVFCYMSSKRCSLQSSSFDMLIEGICIKGEVDRAIRMLPLARYSGTPCASATYNTIMLGLSRTKRGKDLLVVLSQMLVDGCILDVEAYCILIQSMSAQSRAKDCTLFFNMMVREGFVPDSETLACLLSCLADHSQLHMILSAVNKLACDFDILNSSTFNILVNGLWKGGYEREARQLLDLMLEKGWVPDSITHGLLIGSGVREEMDGTRVTDKNSVKQDIVSNILAEGLGKM